MRSSLLFRQSAGWVSDAEANANDLRQGVIAILQLLVTLATAGVFLTWVYRAYKNLSRPGVRGVKYSPGWAVGGFFVPFLNLERPYQVMRELWFRSYPPALGESDGKPEGHSSSPERPTAVLVGWWWGLFLVSGVFSRISARIALAANPTLEQLIGSVADLISDLLDIPAAWLAIRLVGYITRWQNERASRLLAAPLPPATANIPVN